MAGQSDGEKLKIGQIGTKYVYVDEKGMMRRQIGASFWQFLINVRRRRYVAIWRFLLN